MRFNITSWIKNIIIVMAALLWLIGVNIALDAMSQANSIEFVVGFVSLMALIFLAVGVVKGIMEDME